MMMVLITLNMNGKPNKMIGIANHNESKYIIGAVETQNNVDPKYPIQKTYYNGLPFVMKKKF